MYLQRPHRLLRPPRAGHTACCTCADPWLAPVQETKRWAGIRTLFRATAAL